MGGQLFNELALAKKVSGKCDRNKNNNCELRLSCKQCTAETEMSKAKLSEKRLAEQKRKRKSRRRDEERVIKKERLRESQRNEEDAWLRWIENGNRQATQRQS